MIISDQPVRGSRQQDAQRRVRHLDESLIENAAVEVDALMHQYNVQPFKITNLQKIVILKIIQGLTASLLLLGILHLILFQVIPEGEKGSGYWFSDKGASNKKKRSHFSSSSSFSNRGHIWLLFFLILCILGALYYVTKRMQSFNDIQKSDIMKEWLWHPSVKQREVLKDIVKNELSKDIMRRTVSPNDLP